MTTMTDRTMTRANALRGLVAAGLLAGLAACSSDSLQYSYPERDPSGHKGYVYTDGKERDTVFGPGGLNIFGSSEETDTASGTGIGVNSYLWRATLDTFSFMPLVSADPFGGVIITDWHSPPETPDQRFKMNVYILTRDLRADGIRVAVFRQQQAGDGTWRDSPVDETTRTQLENAVLKRARELRVSAAR